MPFSLSIFEIVLFCPVRYVSNDRCKILIYMILGCQGCQLYIWITYIWKMRGIWHTICRVLYLIPTFPLIVIYTFLYSVIYIFTSGKSCPLYEFSLENLSTLILWVMLALIGSTKVIKSTHCQSFKFG